MLLQSLILIAVVLVVSGSIMLETLVSAKAALHQAMFAKTQTAMADATASFVRWTQDHVATYGAGSAAAWPAQTVPMQDANVCPPEAHGEPPPSPCAYAAFATWQIRGETTTGAPTIASPPPGTPDAQNLAPTVNEQRLAATITVRITDPTGRTTFASRTRDVTARLFEAAPYAAITGERDIDAEVGSIHGGEGDTAGAAQYGPLGPQNNTTPNPSMPSSQTDTRIRTTIDCSNRRGFNSRQETVMAEPGEIDYSFHPYGNQDWAYEAPCIPPDGVPTPPPGSSGYEPPTGSLYATTPGDRNNLLWNPGTESESSFPR